MQKQVLAIVIGCISLLSLGQVPEFSGSWQGMIKYNKSRKPDVFWLFLDGSNSKSRMEINGTNKFSCREVLFVDKGKGSFELSELKEKEHTELIGTWWCLSTVTFTYDTVKGYLKGSFKSKNCRGVDGEIILYKSIKEYDYSTEEDPIYQHSWFRKFEDAYAKGEKSPWRMEYDLLTFEFKPIYFDFDSATVKTEYHAYLQEMVNLVKYKHDLILVATGHTDNVGTDAYNDVLSKRRAEAIREFFKGLGLEPHKLEVKFKGEKNPVVPNSSKENRQLNRRVDFSFE